MMSNELAFETPEAAFETVRQMLTHGHYVVMLSREEDLWIVNYEFSEYCDRNDMVFMSREEFEEEYYSKSDDDDDEDEETYSEIDGWKRLAEKSGQGSARGTEGWHNED